MLSNCEARVTYALEHQQDGRIGSESSPLPYLYFLRTHILFSLSLSPSPEKNPFFVPLLRRGRQPSAYERWPKTTWKRILASWRGHRLGCTYK